MTQPKPNRHPFYDVARNATQKIKEGHSVYQQWWCSHCGAKQTMPDENKFYTHGQCEECGRVSDIVKDGCNFMLIHKARTGEEAIDLLTRMIEEK